MMSDNDGNTNQNVQNSNLNEVIYDRYGFYGGQQFTKPEE